KVAEVTHSIFYAPQYLADSLGYFKDEGLDVEFILTPGADKVTASVLSGDVDIGFCSSEATIYVYKNGVGVGNLLVCDRSILVEGAHGLGAALVGDGQRVRVKGAAHLPLGGLAGVVCPGYRNASALRAICLNEDVGAVAGVRADEVHDGVLAVFLGCRRGGSGFLLGLCGGGGLLLACAGSKRASHDECRNGANECLLHMCSFSRHQMLLHYASRRVHQNRGPSPILVRGSLRAVCARANCGGAWRYNDAHPTERTSHGQH
ncbi:MAG: ABC transporter substrate-binding protein, partial [Atopobiaceae bacterium]|nr:ABC transporter substrate-binding protein [Atopobiaceae bacterium]